MEKNYHKWQFLNNSWLKVIALLTMTLDHLGLLLATNGFVSDGDPIYIVLRTLGRFAMPLFTFMIAEGVRHTKNFGKYIMRLGIMAVFISIVLIVLHHLDDPSLSSVSYYGNIFIDLSLGALGAWLLYRKNIGLKLLALLPIIYSVVCFSVNVYENDHNVIIHWWPYFMRTQYYWYSVVMIMIFALVNPFKNFILRLTATNMGADKDTFIGTRTDRTVSNVISAVILVGMTLAYFAFHLVLPFGYMPEQSSAIFACIFILLYNGTRGYNKKWFTYGSYLYYPLHIGILAAIFMLITL